MIRYISYQFRRNLVKMKVRILHVAFLTVAMSFGSLFPVYAAEEQVEDQLMSHEVIAEESVQNMSSSLISLAVESEAVKEAKNVIEEKEKAEREAKKKLNEKRRKKRNKKQENKPNVKHKKKRLETVELW